MEPLIERPLSQAETDVLNRHAARLRAQLKLTEFALPETAAKAVETYVARWRRGEFVPRKRLWSHTPLPPAPDPIKEGLGLGTIWGDALIAKFGWQWVAVRDDDVFVFAVVSPDREWVVYTHGFVGACLQDARLDCTVMLAFNMLAAGNLPAMETNSYEDLMSGVRRII